MATPFEAAPLTTTSGHGGNNDSQAPKLKSLSLGSAIATPGALSGTNGIDCSLVHGKSWYQLENDVTENILQSYYLTVSQNEVHKILQNLNHRVVGTTNDTRVGTHNQTNIAPRNDEFLHTRTETHLQPEAREQKTEDTEKAEQRAKFFEKHFELNTFKLSAMVGPELAVNPVFAMELKGISAAYKLISAETAFLECELKELKTAIQLVASDVVAVKAKAAVSHLKAIAANLNAGIAGNGDSPLG